MLDIITGFGYEMWSTLKPLKPLKSLKPLKPPVDDEALPPPGTPGSTVSGTGDHPAEPLKSDDSRVIFEGVWNKLVAKYGEKSLKFPDEIIYMMGAPASGKGVHSSFLQRAREITTPPIVMSSLLTTPEFKKIVDSGRMISRQPFLSLLSTLYSPLSTLYSLLSTFHSPLSILSTLYSLLSTLHSLLSLLSLLSPLSFSQSLFLLFSGDSSVLELLMESLLRSESSGVIVDGFPRTKTQVDFAIRLCDRLMELRRKYFDTALKDVFRRPRFRIAVLFIEKEESVKRQLGRGMAAKTHNEMVRKRGQGTIMEERSTDFDIELMQKRYDIFREHYDAMLRLKEKFPFHLIDASSSIDEVRSIILREFEYQSSMELDGETYDSIQHLPLAADVGKHARQQLVRRMETYQIHYKDLFKQGIYLIDSEIMPVIKRHSIAGRAHIRT